MAIMKTMSFSEAVTTFLQTVADHFSYWIVGGMVRDFLLDNTDNENLDLVVAASLDAFQQVFPQFHQVGQKKPILISKIENISIEVAPLEQISGNLDDDLRADALQRDLTINAIYYQPEEKRFYDFFEGQQDLQKHLLRPVTNWETMIQDDALRIFRCVRFAFQLDWLLPDDVQTILVQNLVELLRQNTAQERILQELEKIFVADPCKAADWFIQWKLSAFFWRVDLQLRTLFKPIPETYKENPLMLFIAQNSFLLNEFWICFPVRQKEQRLLQLINVFIEADEDSLLARVGEFLERGLGNLQLLDQAALMLSYWHPEFAVIWQESFASNISIWKDNQKKIALFLQQKKINPARFSYFKHKLFQQLILNQQQAQQTILEAYFDQT